MNILCVTLDFTDVIMLGLSLTFATTCLAINYVYQLLRYKYVCNGRTFLDPKTVGLLAPHIDPGATIEQYVTYSHCNSCTINILIIDST